MTDRIVRETWGDDAQRVRDLCARRGIDFAIYTAVVAEMRRLEREALRANERATALREQCSPEHCDAHQTWIDAECRLVAAQNRVDELSQSWRD